MKTIFSTAVLWLIFFVSQSQIPTTGLIGNWQFNGNASDSSGNGNDGVIYGATLTSDRFGNVNSAYSFDGMDDLIQYAISNLPVGSAPRSVFCWAKTLNDSNSFNEQKTLFHYGNIIADQRSAILIWPAFPDYIGQGNDVCYGCSGSTNVNQPASNLDSTWHHIGFTYDSDTLKLYSDGVLSSYKLVTYNTQSTGLFKIGFSDSSHYDGEPFIGDIDEVFMYDRALNQSEVTQLYTNNVITTICASANLPVSLANGILAWYPFCGNANDESGHGNNGSVSGALLTSDRFGNSNSAYQFNGTNDYILTSLMPPIGKSARTISFWARTNDLNIMTAADYGESNSNGGSYQLIFNSPCAGLGLDVSNGVVTRGDTSLINNNWHHCVVVYDSSFGNTISDAKIFIDGIQQQSISCSAVNPIADINTVALNPLNIGRTYSGARFFHGDLDDIGIWDRILTDQEVSNLYNAGLCYQTITVTDTLIINAIFTGFNPVTYRNSIKIYPNPAYDHITIDNGSNYSTLAGYTLRIDNSIGATVFSTSINQQSYTVDLNTWTGNGLYFVYLIDSSGNTIDVRKIVVQ